MTTKGSGGGNRMAQDGYRPRPIEQKGFQPRPGTGKVQGGYQAPGGGKPGAPTTGSGVGGGGSGGGGGKK